MTAAEIDENNPKEEEVVPSMENIEVKSHRERPIPAGSVRGLYDHVGPKTSPGRFPTRS